MFNNNNNNYKVYDSTFMGDFIIFQNLNYFSFLSAILDHGTDLVLFFHVLDPFLTPTTSFDLLPSWSRFLLPIGQCLHSILAWWWSYFLWLVLLYNSTFRPPYGSNMTQHTRNAPLTILINTNLYVCYSIKTKGHAR